MLCNSEASLAPALDRELREVDILSAIHLLQRESERMRLTTT